MISICCLYIKPNSQKPKFDKNIYFSALNKSFEFIGNTKKNKWFRKFQSLFY